MDITCPGSIVEIDVEKVGKKMRFKRIFVALKPCVDGFIAGCRPFMKHYAGDVFTTHLYPAARSYIEGLFKWHLNKIYIFAPEAIKYLKDHHNRIWHRAGFSEDSKCDYLTNNISESFNRRGT